MRMRILGFVVLGALVFTALAAVATLLFGEFDDRAGRILGSSASVAGYCLLAMGGAAALGQATPRTLRLAGWLAIVGSAIGFLAMMGTIWIGSLREGAQTARTFGIATLTTAGLVLIVLLSRLPLAASQLWIRRATAILILLFAVLADVVWILLESNSESLSRAIGVVGVLASLGILVLPVMAWQSARERRAHLSSAPSSPFHLKCPSCGHTMEVVDPRSP